MWTIELNDITGFDKGLEDGSWDDFEPTLIKTWTRKTTQGTQNSILLTTCEMRSYATMEHVVTNDEIYLRCIGQLPTDTDVRIYELIARWS